MSLAEIEKKLYRKETKRQASSRKKKKEIGGVAASTRKGSVPRAWQEEFQPLQEKNNHLQLPKWFVIVVGGIAVVSVFVIGIGVFLLLRQNEDVEGISLKIVGERDVFRGVPFDVDVVLGNQSNLVLKNVSLSLSLPPGIVNLGGEGGDEARGGETEFGDIGIGSLTKRTFRLIATGEINSVAEIGVRASYEITGRTRFEKQASKEFFITAPAIEVKIERPEQVVSGADFEFAVIYENISDQDLPEVVLEAQYPPSFEFISASLAPVSQNGYWRLGELKAGSKGTLTITGRFSGVEGSLFNIPISVSVRFFGTDYPVKEDLALFSIASSPIGLTILVNGDPDYIARVGDSLTYTIQYANQSGLALADVVLQVKLMGELFDFSTLKSDAHYNPLTGILTWNASQMPLFRLLNPGARGEVNIMIKLKPSFPIRRLNDRNFTVRAEATIDSPTVPYYLTAPKTSAVARVETKIAGHIQISSEAYFRDAGSKIANRGPFPPKANTTTEYTVHWKVVNYATDVRDVKITSFLASGVEWTGIVKSNSDSVPLYNERTGEITWNIDKISATRGVLDTPLEAVFQIAATPSAAQINTYMPLVRETRLEAMDEFTGVKLVSVSDELDTSLQNDPTVTKGQGIVIP